MSQPERASLRGLGGAVSAGHYLATEIGAQVLSRGGNAADSACAMGFALQVLEPHMNGPAGEVPILIRLADGRRFAISGQGPAPAAATVEHMRRLDLELIPVDGFLGAVVPAALDAWCLLLEHFGTLTLEDVLSPAHKLAHAGFPMYPQLHRGLQHMAARFGNEWPSSAELYLPVRNVREVQRNPRLADFYARLIESERRHAGSREQSIRAARDFFYKGEPAEQIESFVQDPVRDVSGHAHAGLLTAHDLANYTGQIEEPCSVDYRGSHVYKCGPWTQGPVFLQQLRLLEGFDLNAMGAQSADALHSWIECAKLAFADREACYADPNFGPVPLDTLFSADYAAERRALIDPEKASLELRPGLGQLPAGWPRVAEQTLPPSEPQALASTLGRADTTHLDAVDAHGNLVSATPSGAWIPSSPVIPGLGFPLGTRGQMFVLDPEHPNALAPGKRPRTTLTPSLAELPDGRHLAFGTPGGDQQDQWTLHLFLNLMDFGFEDLQSAIDAPTLHSLHMPSSFWPRLAQPGVVAAESRLPEATLIELERRGHRVERVGAWENGRVLAVAIDPQTGICEAAASTRNETASAAALP